MKGFSNKITVAGVVQLAAGYQPHTVCCKITTFKQQADTGYGLVARKGTMTMVIRLNRTALAMQGEGHDYPPDESLRKELVAAVRKSIGPIATPDTIHWAPGMPKTRAGKIMRRILRKIGNKWVLCFTRLSPNLALCAEIYTTC